MMNRMVVLNLMSALVAVLTTGVVLADQVSGPFKHGNLEIYLLRSAVGAPQPKHDYVPVGAALASGRLRISESGTVGHLVVENTGDRPVFFHVGDLLTGGNQDRAVSRSVVVRPGSGPTTVAVLCVEAGRLSLIHI